jgi:glycosyltransferase involved in cell wall biosynthesis
MSARPSAPKLVTLFRYHIFDQEEIQAAYPGVLASLAEWAEIHRWSFRSPRRHPLQDHERIHFHEAPLALSRRSEIDKWLKTALWIAAAPAIGLWARRWKASLICVEETLPSVAAAARWASGRPVILAGADTFWDVYLPESGLASWLRRPVAAMQRLTLRQIDFFISPTEAHREYLCEMGIARDRIAVVREASRPDLFFPANRADARTALGVAPGEFVLAYHGILNPGKGLDRVLQWLAPVMRQEPRLRFIIGGHGASRTQLAKLAAQLGIADRVQFLGWIATLPEINQLLNAADVSLVMRAGRFSDHFHLTGNLGHSFASGCCTLVARLRGICEVVRDGENGLLFDPTDGAEFVAQLRSAMDSPELRARLGAAARRTAIEELSVERVQREWVAAIKRFLAHSVSP